MNNVYIPTPRASDKCDVCKKRKKYKCIIKEDPSKIAPVVTIYCKKCYNQMK